MSGKVIKEMFENSVHVGHRTQRWNPRVKKFLYGEKDGIHIIDLERTVECFDAALDFLTKNASEGKNVLFVSTKPQSVKLLKDVAADCGMPFVVSKWIPGLLTNFATIKDRIKYLADLKEQEEAGDFDKYTKKEATKLRKVIAKLESALGGVEGVNKRPDVVFVVDVVRDEIVVKEAKKLGIPVVALVDSNADPSLIDYPIPANDDAMKSLVYLLWKVSEAVKGSSKKAA